MKKQSFVQQILKENSLDGSTESRVIFMTIIPDDYHGSPMVDQFAEGDMPTPPDQADVFSAWSEAGYNSYSYLGSADEEMPTEEEVFQDYGNGDGYYVVYLLIINSNKPISDLEYTTNETIGGEGSWLAEGTGPSVEEMVEVLSGIPFVDYVLPLDTK